MKRRALLQWLGAGCPLFLAGCIGAPDGPSAPTNDADRSTTPDSEGSPTGDHEPSATGEETPSPAMPTVTDATVQTVGSGCRSDESPTAIVTFPDEETVGFSGRLTTPTPCHRVTVEAVTYDEQPRQVAVALGTESGSGACAQCQGTLRFEGTVTVTGGPPSRARIVHEGQVLAAVEGSD